MAGQFAEFFVTNFPGAVSRSIVDKKQFTLVKAFLARKRVDQSGEVVFFVKKNDGNRHFVLHGRNMTYLCVSVIGER